MTPQIRILTCAIALALAAPVFAALPKPAPRVANPAVKGALAPGLRAPSEPPKPVAVDLPPLSAAQIIDKNVAARGGLAAWQRVQSMTMAGKMDAGKRRVDGGQYSKTLDPKTARAERRAAARKILEGGAVAKVDNTIQLPFQMELKRPLMSRLEVEFKGDKAVQVYDGTNGWKLRPYLGRNEVESFTPAEAKIAAAQQPLDGPLINYAAKGTKVEVAGGEKVEGRNAYKLNLTLKTGEVRHVWVDAQSFLDIKIDAAPRIVNGKPREVATFIRDYKQVEGLMVPTVLETKVEGYGEGRRIVVERVALNSITDDTRFAKPQ